MKIKLTMRGGIYGSQEFEPVDTDDPAVDLPAELQTFLSEPANESEATSATEQRTEGQTYRFDLSLGDDSSRTLRLSESALQEDARYQELFDCVWRHAKPVSQE